MQKPPPSYSNQCLRDFLALAYRQKWFLDSQSKRDSHLIRQGSELQGIAASQNKFGKKLDHLSEAIALLCDRQSLLEEASKRQTMQATDQAQAEIVDLISPKLIQMFDLSGLPNNNPSGDSPERRVLEAVRAEALDVLDSIGIRPFSNAQPGDQFDNKLMKVFQFHYTADPQKHGTVSKVERLGFAKGDRVLRRMAVALYSTDSQTQVQATRQKA